MNSTRSSVHGEWSTRLAFILAATGSAVGLGNIWRFPYMAGENGGGAFVIVYLACVLLIGLPIMMSEVLTGRRGRRNPMDSLKAVAEDEGRSTVWQYAGLMGIVTGVFILSFYSVVAGWALAYVPNAARGLFAGMTEIQSEVMFDRLTANPWLLLGWHTLFMGMTVAVTIRGVRHGLEKAVRILMPALFVLLLVMVGYGMQIGDFERAVEFLFRPDFGALGTTGVLAAMGQAFFTLSLGMGAIMIYGSYLPSKASIPGSAVVIALTDTLVAVLAGLAIFPIVFGSMLEPSAGPGLVFLTLPLAFGQMPYGSFFATVFFVLLVFGAWTSAISLMEPIVTWLVERINLSRVSASLLAGGGIWLLGIGSVLSFNTWSGYTLFDMTFFDVLDSLTANIMLPLGGLFIALFAGWVVSRKVSAEELEGAPAWVYPAWRFVIRYITPVAVLAVFLNAIGVFQN